MQMHVYILWSSDDLSHLRSYTEVHIEWPTEEEAWIPRRKSTIPSQLEKNHVVSPSSQDEAFARHSVSREVPRFILKFETVFGKLREIPKFPDIPVSLKGITEVPSTTSSEPQGWALKNWCFRTVVLEKTLESPLDSKEIKPGNSKGNQTIIFIGRTDAEALILRPPDAKRKLFGKDPDTRKD